MRKTVRPLCAALLIALALSQTACAIKPLQTPAESPQLPPPPSLSTPLPLQSYSAHAAETIKTWRARLTATRLMSE